MSREHVLADIRASIAAAGDCDRSIELSQHSAPGTLSSAQRQALFIERLHEYGARVFEVQTSGVADSVASVLRKGDKQRMLAPRGLPPHWLVAGVNWIADAELSYEMIESVDGVLTTATAAVAESGTLVLSHGLGEGRRILTLLPDYHLCIIYESQIVQTLPECFARLADAQQRPLTFVSGPSATADIEMTRIKGVHGPRFLDVLLVDDRG